MRQKISDIQTKAKSFYSQKPKTTIAIWVGVLFFIIFLFSGDSAVEEGEKSAKDFYISTQNISEFSTESFLTKTSKIASSSDITLTSNTSGRVWELLVKEWDQILEWQPLVRLEDNIANYYLSLQRAENDLERARINYDSNKITLEQNVFNAELEVERLQTDYDNLKIQTEADILQAKQQLEDADFTVQDSKANVELQRIENSIERSQLDYDTQVVRDEETINNFKTTLSKDLNAQLIFLDDIIEFHDRLLNVTGENDQESERVEDFLWSEDITVRNATIQSLRDLILFRDWEFKTRYDAPIQTEDDIKDTLDLILKGYDESKELLNNMEQTLNFSLPSEWRFGQADIDGKKAEVNWFQSQLQWSLTSFAAYENTVLNFLRTYRNNQASLQKSIEILFQDKEILQRNVQHEM